MLRLIIVSVLARLAVPVVRDLAVGYGRLAESDRVVERVG
jgi:hypothetical protein